jgi:hypothetical protein
VSEIPVKGINQRVLQKLRTVVTATMFSVGFEGNATNWKSTENEHFHGYSRHTHDKRSHSQIFIRTTNTTEFSYRDSKTELRLCLPRKSQAKISLTSQSRIGYAKYSIKNEGSANSTVIRIYNNKTAALAGIA